VAGGVVPLVLAAWTAVAADLTITVTGLRSEAGMLRFAVFDNPADFPRGQEAAGEVVPAEREVTVVIDGLDAGRYAVAVHHDENGNGRMDTSLIGLPQEGYAFSKDAIVFMGPPPFADASFDLPDEGRHITITMDY
jgi:uncharacterized protein (DUF2141 family)